MFCRKGRTVSIVHIQPHQIGVDNIEFIFYGVGYSVEYQYFAALFQIFVKCLSCCIIHLAGRVGQKSGVGVAGGLLKKSAEIFGVVAVEKGQRKTFPCCGFGYLEAWVAQRTHEDNEMSGRYEGKNLMLIQLESIDTWMLTEAYMPNLYALKQESLSFVNHFTPAYITATSVAPSVVKLGLWVRTLCL